MLNTPDKIKLLASQVKTKKKPLISTEGLHYVQIKERAKLKKKQRATLRLINMNPKLDENPKQLVDKQVQSAIDMVQGQRTVLSRGQRKRL